MTTGGVRRNGACAARQEPITIDDGGKCTGSLTASSGQSVTQCAKRSFGKFHFI